MSNNKKLGLIAGSGMLPIEIIRECQRSSLPVSVISLGGTCDINQNDYPNIEIQDFSITKVGAILKFLNNQNVSDVILAGRIERPDLTKLIPDLKGAKLLKRLLSLKERGDDKLFQVIAAFFAEENFPLIGIADILPDLLTPEGVLSKKKPEKTLKIAAEHALYIAKESGRLDIGQAAIISQGQVIGVEGAEGTDELITRCNKWIKDRDSILAKACKPQQDERIDMPTIGVDTIKNAAKASIKIIALEAHKTIILEREKVIELSDENDIILMGM